MQFSQTFSRPLVAEYALTNNVFYDWAKSTNIRQESVLKCLVISKSHLKWELKSCSTAPYDHSIKFLVILSTSCRIGLISEISNKKLAKLCLLMNQVCITGFQPKNLWTKPSITALLLSPFIASIYSPHYSYQRCMHVHSGNKFQMHYLLNFI